MNPASWSYTRTAHAQGRRDLRLDLLRGFCVFVMVVDHVGGEASWLYLLTGGNRFVVSAAEGFVLLSGISMGMAHRGTVARSVRSMLEKVAGRAGLLYFLTVALTLAFAAASSVLGAPWAAAATPASSRTDFALSVITLHRSYSLTDVLFLYTVLVLAAGPVIWLLSRGHTGLVLSGSGLLWVIQQLWPADVPSAWTVIDGGFPLAAWQLMFFSGLAIGFHRRRLADYLRPAPLLAFAAAAVIALVAVQVLAVDLLNARGAGTLTDVREMLFDKHDVRPGRVIALFGLAAFAYAFVTLAWRPIHAASSWLLLTLGTRALFAYGVQLFVVAIFSSELIAPLRLNQENAIFQATAVAMVWIICLRQPQLATLGSRLLATLREAPLAFVRAARPVTVALAGILATGCVLSAPSLQPMPAITFTEPAQLVGSPVGSESRVFVTGASIASGTFSSRVLGRTMPYTVFLPPGYRDSTTERYPTIYLLHGGGGSNTEWADFGVFDVAERLMLSGTLRPTIIVLPQGDQEYWLDHVVSKIDDGAKWGTYTAREVVPEIDRRFRTIASAQQRAIGGLSMGGHAAIQLPLNFPGIWSVIGAHSPSIRPPTDSPTYFGTGGEFAARDPLSLITAKPDLARTYSWWVDAGDMDPWRDAASAIDEKLTALGIAHEWRLSSGDHSAEYWTANLEDYLLFYGRALRSRS